MGSPGQKGEEEGQEEGEGQEGEEEGTVKSNEMLAGDL